MDEIYRQFFHGIQGANPATRSLTLPLMTNLKNARIMVSGLDEEIALIGCLLRNAPSLQTMTVTLPTCSGYVHQQSFLEQIFRLNRSSGQATVHITANGWDMCKTCVASSLYEERSSSDEEATTSLILLKAFLGSLSYYFDPLQ